LAKVDEGLNELRLALAEPAAKIEKNEEVERPRGPGNQRAEKIAILNKALSRSAEGDQFPTRANNGKF
jgi:hypothetical protein